MQRKKILTIIMLCMLVLQACAKPVPATKESDWREQYGHSLDVPVTPEPEPPVATAKPTGSTSTAPELPFPTPLPVREFVPEEGQVELVLWMFEMVAGDPLDEYILAELNYILQQRGYSFYLTKKIEPYENRIDQISLWQEALDSGETVDLLYLGNEDTGLAYREYGNTAVVRAITGGYLLPFSQYPETEAKARLLSAYPEEYWRLCSFGGDNYGVSNTLSNFLKQKNYLMLNLDAAAQMGIELPEELDVMNLDELLQQAEEAGVPGIEGLDPMGDCGIRDLNSGLYVKYMQDGTYRIVNPLEDEELLACWEAKYRYKENGWQGDSYETGELPLILYQMVTEKNWDGESFYKDSEKGEISARFKVYEEKERFFVEGDYNQIFGIATSSQHKEEALELLSLMHSDEEIVQLLRYGIEGVHYRIGEEGLENVTTAEVIEFENGGKGIKYITRQSPARTAFGSVLGIIFGNQLMYVELEEQLGQKNMEEEWHAGLSDIVFIPYLEEFSEAQKAVQEKIREITYIVGKNGTGIRDIAGSLISMTEDYKAQIEKLRTDFAEAGYNELAEEINKKYGLE